MCALLLAGAASPAAARIVTLAPHLAELVYAAGAGDKLVGTVAYSDFPSAATELPRVGDAFRVDFERVAALRPDLVLAWGGGNPPTLVAELERLGFKVVSLKTSRLAQIGDQLRRIGELAGTAATATAAADAFEARLAGLRAAYNDATPVRVFYQVAARPLYTVGADHSLNDAIELCGGVNVFGELEAPAPVVGLEAVLARDPEVIVGGVHPLPAPGELGALAGWQRWPRIAAVANGHVYPLDADVMGRPTPRLLDGVERLCKVIDRAR